MVPLLVSPLRIVSLTRWLQSAMSHYGSVILCLALTRLPVAVITQRRVRRSLGWNASSAYTDDGGGPAIREEYFFGGTEMPHAILRYSLPRAIWTGLAVAPSFELSECDNICSNICTHFDSPDKEALLKFCENAGREFLTGYGDCGFVIVFAHCCPNDSVSILNVNYSKLEGLFRRHEQSQMKRPGWPLHLKLPFKSGPSLGPSSESSSITLRPIPPIYSNLTIAFSHGRYHTLSLCIALGLNRHFSDFGSAGWGFNSLRAHHYTPEKTQDGITEGSVAHVRFT